MSLFGSKKPSIQVSVFARTDVGQQREHNEDSFLVADLTRQNASLLPEVRNHEPLAALSPGGDGLGAIRRIAAGVGSLLAPGGRLLVEIGPRQAEAVGRILTDAGLAVTAVLPDLDGRDRVVCAEI